MIVKGFTVNPFSENTYICHDDGEAVLIDPGSSTSAERNLLLDYVTTNDLKVRHLLLTHGHIDHVIDCAFFAEHLGLGIQMHEEDLPLLHDAPKRGEVYGVPVAASPEPERFLTPDDTISFGSATWTITHCPGHSPGSICFHDAANGFVIAGDVLFQRSVGRTDLWKGSMDVLLKSINENLMTLPDETIVYAGHGPATTVGEERTSNPFL